MEHDGRDAEALRRRLYRPGASARDLESYLDAAPAEASPAATPEHRGGRAAAVRVADAQPEPEEAGAPRGRRPALLVLVGAAAVAVLAGAAIAVGGLARPAAPVPSGGAPTGYAAWTSAPRDPGDSMVATAVVDEGRRPHATGEAVPAAEQGYLYTIATGDTVLGIAARFRLCTADVLVALPYGVDPSRLPEAQRLLLGRGPAVPSATAPAGAC